MVQNYDEQKILSFLRRYSKAIQLPDELESFISQNTKNYGSAFIHLQHDRSSKLFHYHLYIDSAVRKSIALFSDPALPKDFLTQVALEDGDGGSFWGPQPSRETFEEGEEPGGESISAGDSSEIEEFLEQNKRQQVLKGNAKNFENWLIRPQSAGDKDFSYFRVTEALIKENIPFI